MKNKIFYSLFILLACTLAFAGESFAQTWQSRVHCMVVDELKRCNDTKNKQCIYGQLYHVNYYCYSDSAPTCYNAKHVYCPGGCWPSIDRVYGSTVKAGSRDYVSTWQPAYRCGHYIHGSPDYGTVVTCASGYVPLLEGECKLWCRFGTPISFIECPFYIKTEAGIQKFACYPLGGSTSPLRVRKGNDTYHVVLVETTATEASKVMIRISNTKTMALRRYP